MRRNLNKLANTSYDLLVIGGGITGAYAAWDASLRGLSVVVVDKGDFGGATSAASGKMIHGGLRYLQYGAFLRVIESMYERMVFLKTAPHFVHPIPFLMPSFGHFLKNRGILDLGLKIYDLLAFSNKGLRDFRKAISSHRVLSRDEVLALEPDITKEKLTGGVIYYDCQMHNPERLTLSILLAANSAGAELANYLKAVDFCRSRNRIAGVKVRDAFTGEEFDIQGKVIVNACGPWMHSLLTAIEGSNPRVRMELSKGIHIVTRSITKDHALALPTKHRHTGALLQRGGRHLFIIPWRNHSLIGTTNVHFEGSPDDKMVTEQDILGLIEEVNAAYPAANLRRKDVVFFYGGLYPDNPRRSVEDGYQGARKDQIFDHGNVEGIGKLISVIGVKYTTARKLAQRTTDLVFSKLGYKPPKCLTDRTPVHGGQVGSFDKFLSQEIEKNSIKLDREIVSHLIYNYGSFYKKIISYTENNRGWGARIHADLPVIKAQVLHAVREEMALKLSDVVFRRTGLGTVGNPGQSSLQICTSIMAKELGWNAQRIQKEMAEVKDVFSPV